MNELSEKLLRIVNARRVDRIEAVEEFHQALESAHAAGRVSPSAADILFTLVYDLTYYSPDASSLQPNGYFGDDELRRLIAQALSDLRGAGDGEW